MLKNEIAFVSPPYSLLLSFAFAQNEDFNNDQKNYR